MHQIRRERQAKVKTAILAGAMVFVGACSWRESPELQELKRFVREEGPVKEEGSVRVGRPPEGLVRYASERYGTDPEVRRVLAEYFLRCQRRDLARGMLDVGDMGELLGVFISAELALGHIDPESPATIGILEGMREHAGWLSLGKQEHALLRDCFDVHAEYVRRATGGAR